MILPTKWFLPLALPILFGIDDMTKGTIAKSVMDVLATTIDGGAFWAKCITGFDNMKSNELVRVASYCPGKVGN